MDMLFYFILLFQIHDGTLSSRTQACEFHDDRIIFKDGYYEYDTSRINPKKKLRELDSIVHLFEKAFKFNENNVFGIIVDEKINWYSANVLFWKVNDISLFLSKKTDYESRIVGIYSENRYEWLLIEQAVYRSNKIFCPIYTKFNREAIHHVLNETDMKVCFISKSQAKRFYDDILSLYEIKLEHVIFLDRIDDDLAKKIRLKNIKIDYLDDIQRIELPINISRCFPTLEDIAMYCYTSGTSGFPKGVKQTHKNILKNIESYVYATNDNMIYKFHEYTIYLSYLPLAHVMEHMICYYLMISNSKIVFIDYDYYDLHTALRIVQPTVFVAVPRVLEKIYNRINQELNSKNAITRHIFRKCLNVKINNQQRKIYKHSIYDYFIFREIKMIFGGRIESIMCGSAPLRKDISMFLQAIFSIPIIEGYGLTESTGVCIMSPINNPRLGTIGVPLPGTKIKLLPTDDHDGFKSGELSLKADFISIGYFKNESLDAELFSPDSWFATGDIATVYGSYFQIIGRVKEMFKNSLGEYITPEFIEKNLKIPIIDDILITGKNTYSYIIALVVCLKHEITPEYIYNEIREKGEEMKKRNILFEFQIPKKIYVLRNTFESFRDFITPTVKKRRIIIEKYFAQQIDRIYNQDILYDGATIPVNV
ncbi:long-chain fatty acid CoA synthetase [Hamiltosporidium tvaerminnensis]|uniref:Long-chain fatty acid CoA synthetase n=1 Tax=Hamiltosporidium tvaerminnensis TaxID=1176355 RepID=A0A4Q9LBL7_9MICR|nr:hypothetical protein LUQ84_000342 [Hamiltosporidium tvaerminnensis]TBU05223.1 long-chain fatty acid CoA synthetase [Hamiltosporidium tvaerminnensis]